MKILFSNANILNTNGVSDTNIYLATENDKITYIGKDKPEDKAFDRVINAENMLLTPALYNTHTHLPMALLKGIGENMALQPWLEEKIFPAENKFTPEMAYYGTMLAIAENIKNGCISYTDMYNFGDEVVRAVSESGTKINFGRAVMAFDESENPADNFRIKEAVELYEKYHNSENGRIKIDMSVHAEYTSNPGIAAYVGEAAKKYGLNMHVHISETKKEHEECIARRGMTPIKYFNSLGLFSVPATAAHCVFITEEDMDIMREKCVSAAHCPISNLKLASGILDIVKLIGKGVNVTFGTDSSASNNRQDILEEIFISSILQKVSGNDPTRLPTTNLLDFATINSAKSQGRMDCGSLKEGNKADMTVFDLNKIEAAPYYNFADSLFYSMRSACVLMTISDGVILYENGEFKTIDIEKVKYNVRRIVNENYR